VHDERIIVWTSLRPINRTNGRVIVAPGAQAVDGFGGEGNQMAIAKEGGGALWLANASGF
jgi:hypothetical protein